MSTIKYLETTTPSLSIGDTVFTGWDSLQAFQLVASTAPEITYSVDVAQRQAAVTLTVVTSAESMFEYLRVLDVARFGEVLPDTADERHPVHCELLVHADIDGVVLPVFKRVFLAWREGVDGIAFAHPQPGNMTAQELADSAFFSEMHPNVDLLDGMFNSLDDVGRRMVASGAIAHVQLAKMLVAAAIDSGAGESLGAALPDDPIIGRGNAAWGGALDSLPDLPFDVAAEAEAGLAEFEKFLEGN
jgi:hypothetical protein